MEEESGFCSPGNDSEGSDRSAHASGFRASALGPAELGTSLTEIEAPVCCMPILAERRFCRSEGSPARSKKHPTFVCIRNPDQAEGLITAAIESNLRTHIYNSDGEGPPVRALARFLACLGRAEESELLWHRAMQEDEARCKDSISTALSAVARAACLEDLGRSDEAEPLYRRAIAIFAARGKSYEVSQTEAALALCRCAQGQGGTDPTKGLLFQLEVQPGTSETVSTMQVSKARALASICGQASSLSERGQAADAESFHRKALCVLRRYFGSYHPETQQTLNNLAACIGDQGKLDTAEQLLRRAFFCLAAAEGAEFPRSLNALGNLAFCLADQGRFEEAEELHRRVLEGFQRSLGNDHTETKAAAESLSAFLSSCGRTVEASLIPYSGPETTLV